MSESVDRPDEVICPGCGRFNAEGTHFCEHCGAPLTVHATTDPVGTIYAEGYAARRALEQPPKRIIVVGIWLWMLPLAIVSLGGLFVSIGMFVYGVLNLDLNEVVGALLAVLPSSVGLWISCTFLSRVTRRALQAKAALNGKSGSV